MKYLVVFLVVVFLTTGCFCSFADTIYTASLSIDQVVPLPNDPPPTYGVAVCIYERNLNPPKLDCEVQHDIVSITAAYIQYAPRGYAGTTIYNFTTTLAFNFHQIFTFLEDESYPIEEQVDDFLHGLWEIIICSVEYPGGQIRGQLEHADRFYARLSVANTIPRASGTSAHGLAVGTYSHYRPDRQLNIDLVHSINFPINNGLQLRKGHEKVVGPIVYAFSDAVSPIFTQIEYTIDEEIDFYSDIHYLNVLSKSNPSGEIRGQIVTIDYAYAIAFTARISDAENVDSNHRGCTFVTYDCTTKVLEYIVMHNVANVTGIIFGGGEKGKAGTPLWSSHSFRTPVFGSRVLTPSEEYLLYTNQLYVLITSTDFPAGELIGYYTTDFDWVAYLSGTNIVPPISTPAVGCATFRLTTSDGSETADQLNYEIFHSVELPLQAFIQVAYEGSNGPVDRVLDSVFSPIRGNDIILDDDELEALTVDALYVTVTSEDFPLSGEVRGQLRRINPCNPQSDNQLSITRGSIGVDVPSAYYNPGAGNSSSSLLEFNLFVLLSFVAIVIFAYVF